MPAGARPIPAASRAARGFTGAGPHQLTSAEVELLAPHPTQKVLKSLPAERQHSALWVLGIPDKDRLRPGAHLDTVAAGAALALAPLMDLVGRVHPASSCIRAPGGRSTPG